MVEKLKSMLKNLDNFVEILSLSRTVYAKDWDVLNVQRALEWGSYFQQVYHRFRTNDAVRNAIEDHLAAKNEALRDHFKNYKDITFRDLEKGKAIFCMALLHNNAVSTFVFKHLVELLQDSDPEKIDSLCLNHIISQKAASELFLSLPMFVSKTSQKTLDDPVLVTQADFLENSLQRRISKLEDNQKLSAMSDVLCKLPQPLVYHLISAVLSKDTVGTDNLSHLHDLILEWLLSNDVAWTEFCSNVNHQVLANLSSRFVKFRQTYLDHLVKLGDSMEQDFSSGMWASQNPKLSFYEFLEHFKYLLRGPEDLRECTITRLQTLKCQDYVVPGISIWADIFMELNKS